MAVDTLHQEPLPVISRVEAISAGLDRYFTGDICSNGHTSERFVLNRQCVSCNKMHTDARAAAKRAVNDAVRSERQKHVSQKIVTRPEARAAGQVRYFTGLPCSNGHVVERLTSSGGCVICSKQMYDRWRAENPEKARAAAAAWVAANPERVKARNKAIYAADPEYWKQRAKNWRRDNPEKAKEMDAKSRAKRIDRIKEYRKAQWVALCRDPDAKALYQERVKAYRVRNRERLNARRREWRLKNIDRVRKANAAWCRANRETVQKKIKAWHAANPEKQSFYGNKRRARKRGAEGFYTVDDIRQIHKAQKGRCACCRQKVGNDYHVDHIIPLAKGGSNWPKNLQITCPPCNQSKHARDPIDFMQSRGLLL